MKTLLGRGGGTEGGYWDGLECGVDMKIDMAMDMGPESLSRACSKRCTLCIEASMEHERTPTRRHRSIYREPPVLRGSSEVEAGEVLEARVAEDRRRACSLDWEEEVVVTAGKSTMGSGRWEGQYKLLAVLSTVCASCALRQHYSSM